MYKGKFYRQHHRTSPPTVVDESRNNQGDLLPLSSYLDHTLKETFIDVLASY